MGKLGKVKGVLLDILSFGSPQAIVFNLSGILVLLASLPTRYLEKGPSICIFKNLILPLVFRGNCPGSGWFAGCECLACGMMRGMSRLLHGELTGAGSYNKLVFLVFLVMVVLIAVNLIKTIKYYEKIS